MLKILQPRLQQYVNHKLPDGQAGFRKDRGTVLRWFRIEWGDHFLPDKFIKKSFELRTNSTKQLLNAGGGLQEDMVRNWQPALSLVENAGL